MLIIISPAKILNLKPQTVVTDYTIPEFLDKSEALIHYMRQLSIDDLADLYGANLAIAKTNYARFYNWQLPFTTENAKQAILMFNGEVYNGLDAKTFSPDDFAYLQNHLRILSGLYAVIRPLDLIQPYRLEIGSKFEPLDSNNLYDYWGEAITLKLNEVLKKDKGSKILVNLASGEYFKSVQKKKLLAKVLDIEFYELQGDKLKTIVVYTKKARGLMARFIIKNRIEDPEQLKAFNVDGYWFNPELSSEEKFVFVR